MTWWGFLSWLSTVHWMKFSIVPPNKVLWSEKKEGGRVEMQLKRRAKGHETIPKTKESKKTKEKEKGNKQTEVGLSKTQVKKRKKKKR